MSFFLSLCLVFCLCLTIRILVSLFPYSGYQHPPMFGDFEAQRHWMEITLNLPIQHWYLDSFSNDLSYWGLDYPPLTAYHSRLLGSMGQWVVGEEMVKLGTSRGWENIETKRFMRMTVLGSDGIVFMSAVWMVVGVMMGMERRMVMKRLRKGEEEELHQGVLTDELIAVLVVLMAPPFILIDHGHFQYNCVCLGLVVFAIYFVFKKNELASSFFFVLALCFKQTALYFAPAFFFYFLSLCLHERSWAAGLHRLIWIGVIVVVTFVIMFLPFLSSVELFAQVLHRLFPFARGLYEDKVANFWCATNFYFRWKEFAIPLMSKISLFTTLFGLVPIAVALFRNPTRLSFVFALFASSMCFFLFSFQVHEKSILFPFLPFILLASIERSAHFYVAWFSTVATFSLLPLLEKDGLLLPYYVLQFLYGIFVMHSASAPRGIIKQFGIGSIVCVLLLHAFWHFGPVVARYPDLKQLAVATFCATQFFAFYLLSLYFLFALPKEDGIEEKLKSN